MRDAVVGSWETVIVRDLISNLAASILVLTLELIVFFVVKLQLFVLIILLNVEFWVTSLIKVLENHWSHDRNFVAPFEVFKSLHFNWLCH